MTSIKLFDFDSESQNEILDTIDIQIVFVSHFWSNTPICDSEYYFV